MLRAARDVVRRYFGIDQQVVANDYFQLSGRYRNGIQGDGIFPGLEHVAAERDRADFFLIFIQFYCCCELLERREIEFQETFFTQHVQGADAAGFRYAFDAFNREPVFRPTVGCLRGEEVLFVRRIAAARCRLVIHAAGLQFDILPVGVGQQVFPDGSFARKAPKEDFHAQLVIIIGVMDGAEIRIVPVSTIEVVVFADYMIRL